MKEVYQIYNIRNGATTFQGTLQECMNERQENQKKYMPEENFRLRESLARSMK